MIAPPVLSAVTTRLHQAWRADAPNLTSKPPILPPTIMRTDEKKKREPVSATNETTADREFQTQNAYDEKRTRLCRKRAEMAALLQSKRSGLPSPVSCMLKLTARLYEVTNCGRGKNAYRFSERPIIVEWLAEDSDYSECAGRWSFLLEPAG
jgi:hypothetical protein